MMKGEHRQTDETCWVGGGPPWFDKMCWPVKNPQERVAHAQSCGDNENKLERRPNGEGWLGGV